MKLLIWLGNPGKKYEKTRHNIWFHFLDLRNKNYQADQRKFQAKFQGDLITTEREWEKLLLCKPQTYMNCSWNVIAPLVRFYQIEPKDILILHDEIDFPTGKIALKFWGSSAGHNGLKSTIDKLWTRDFWRLRIGIDRPVDQSQVSNWVLSIFKSEERQILEEKSDQIFSLIQEFLSL